MSDLLSGSLLRLLARPVTGGKVISFGDDSDSLLEVFMSDAAEATLVVSPGTGRKADVTGFSTLALAHWDDLPFGSASVALAILPPPAAWPCDKTERQRWLTEVRRILTKDGEILMIAPNRFGHKRLRRRLRGRVNDAALSLPGYRRWLKRDGYERIECFGLRRDRSGLVTGVTPIGAITPAWSLPFPRSLKDGIKRWLRLANEVALLASNRAGARSTTGDLLQFAADQLGVSGNLLTIERLFASAKGKGFLVLGSAARRWLVRISLTDGARLAAERHVHMLQRVRQRTGGVNWLPEIMAIGWVNGLECQIESAMPGRALRHQFSREDPAVCLDDLLTVLQQINPFVPAQATVVLNGERYRRLVEDPLERVFKRADTEVQKARVGEFLERHLHGMSYLPGLVHGDLSLSNILVTDRRICGLIDWDDAREDDIPVLDAISHLVSRELHRLRRRAYGEVLGRLAFSDWPISEEQDFLDAMYRHCRISTVHHPGLVCLNWLHTADSRLADSNGGRSDLVRQFVSEVIDQWVAPGRLP